MTDHPVVAPWQRLKGFLAWGVIANAERPPEAPLADHLAPRREVALAVARAAHAVIDAIDQSPGGRSESPRCSFILTQGSNAGEPCGWIAKTMTGDGPRCFAHAPRESCICRMSSEGLIGWNVTPGCPVHDPSPAREDREMTEQEADELIAFMVARAEDAACSDPNCSYRAEVGMMAPDCIARGCAHRMDADELPGERSEPLRPDDVLSRVRVVWEAHRGEPLTSDNYYRLVLDLQAVLDAEDS